MSNSNIVITVITCTYNRAHTLPNVFKSLCRQDYKEFEWIVADDGSSDNTKELVESWLRVSSFPIIYFFQENSGKHIASNEAIKRARGIFIVNLDSDDVMSDNALSTFISAWNSIPEKERPKYMSVKARCYDPDSMLPLGKEVPNGKMTCTFLDAKYKYKLQEEMWSMVRADVLKKYPNPDIKKGKGKVGLRFYPEGIWQDLASRKYVTLFINDAIRGYTRSFSASLIGRGAKYDRYPENIYLWSHILNDNFEYFRYDPKSFIKAAVGVSMDSFFLGITLKEMLGLVNTKGKKCLVLILLPIGFICYLKRK